MSAAKHPVFSSQSKRIHERLEEYWDSKKNGRAFPSEVDIDPDEISDIWESCFLVKVEEQDGKPYQYTYLGQDLISAYGDDQNEKEVCEKLVYPYSVSLEHKFDEVVEQKKPVMEDAEFTNSNSIVVKYRSSMLPLGENGEVEYIIGGMKWKGF
ncbi:MAG: hypothetical protein CMM94_00710 [Rickettsiales bacterium]|nr:hypothetical protein [Rickettsiales bacterium]|tara:strand:+ start:36 stop:497 length:462 start_codon:yes stop_codon:yes gene_type:complete